MCCKEDSFILQWNQYHSVVNLLLLSYNSLFFVFSPAEVKTLTPWVGFTIIQYDVINNNTHESIAGDKLNIKLNIILFIYQYETEKHPFTIKSN